MVVSVAVRASQSTCVYTSVIASDYQCRCPHSVLTTGQTFAVANLHRKIVKSITLFRDVILYNVITELDPYSKLLLSIKRVKDSAMLTRRTGTNSPLFFVFILKSFLISSCL